MHILTHVNSRFWDYQLRKLRLLIIKTSEVIYDIFHLIRMQNEDKKK
jgi:hypothetical protein